MRDYCKQTNKTNSAGPLFHSDSALSQSKIKIYVFYYKGTVSHSEYLQYPRHHSTRLTSQPRRAHWVLATCRGPMNRKPDIIQPTATLRLSAVNFIRVRIHPAPPSHNSRSTILSPAKRFVWDCAAPADSPVHCHEWGDPSGLRAGASENLFPKAQERAQGLCR